MSFVKSTGLGTRTRIRWGGASAVLAGFSYGAAGYLDTPGVSGYASDLVSALGVATPVLLLGGLLGLRYSLRGELSFAAGVGLLIGCLGCLLGAEDAVIRAAGMDQTLLGLLSSGRWWWALFFAGLTLMGLAILRKATARRLLGALVLASGVLGWVSLLTDPAFPGVLVPVRPVHVAFAASFCLSCVVWGWLLFVSRPRSLVHPKL